MSILIWQSIYYSTTVYHIILPRIIPYHITPCRIIMSHFYHSTVYISICNIHVCRIYMESIMYDDGGVWYLNHKRSSKEEEDSTSILKCPVMTETWGPDFHAEGRGQELTWAGGWWHAHLKKNKQTQSKPKRIHTDPKHRKKPLTQQNLHSRVFVGLACWFGTFQKGLVLDPWPKHIHLDPRLRSDGGNWHIASCAQSDLAKRAPKKKNEGPQWNTWCIRTAHCNDIWIL